MAVGRLRPSLPNERSIMLPSRTCALIITLAALAGCSSGPGPADAIFHYTQLGACKQANINGLQANAGQFQAIAIFHVSSIDNTQVNTTWTYNAANLGVNPPRATVSNLGSNGTTTIPAKANVRLTGFASFVGIVVNTGNQDGSDAATSEYSLFYNRPQGFSGPDGFISENATSFTKPLPFAQNCALVIG
jgi:hypothetical protein